MQQRRVFFATIPRSGNAYLLRLLRGYFGEDAVQRIKTAKDGSFAPADPDAQLVVYRTHDRRLRAEPMADVPTVIQYREPLGRILSYVDYVKTHKGMVLDEEKLRAEARYVAGFLRKWVMVPPANALCIDYAHLIADPEAAFRAVIALIGADYDPDRYAAAMAEEARRLRDMAAADPKARTTFPRDTSQSATIPLDWAKEHERLVRSMLPEGLWS